MGDSAFPLPRRIPGAHLRPEVPAAEVDQARTIFRARASILRLDPLAPGTRLEMDDCTPTFDQLVRVAERLRAGPSQAFVSPM